MTALSHVPVSEPFAINKQRVAETFGRAAHSYDAAATLQQQVAARTRLGLPQLPESAHILDMGCGTGAETRALAQHYPHAHLTGMDLSAGMLAYAQEYAGLSGCRWIAGDMEELPFDHEQFDLVFSSLAMQWCESFSEVLRQVNRVLKPGGRFVFSTLAEGSLFELAEAWKQVDSDVHVNSYESFSMQEQRVINSPLSLVSFRKQTETLHYPTVMHLLREMKSLGASTVVQHQRSGLSGRKTLKSLTRSYQSFVTEQGIPATYKVIYGVLQKGV